MTSGAHSQLSELKNKVNQYSNGSFGNGEVDMEMPDFRLKNHERSKSFWKRLELGGNMQTQKARAFFPVTSDVAATLGYKVNDNCVGGIGISGKIGFGHGWNNIKLSYQGINLRSFIDYKLQGSFWITAGYEQNYHSAFNSIAQLKDYSAWSASGLAGLTKSYRLSKKLKGNMQLLWDFLSYRQIPRTQNALLFRVGYSFK